MKLTYFNQDGIEISKRKLRKNMSEKASARRILFMSILVTSCLTSTLSHAMPEDAPFVMQIVRPRLQDHLVTLGGQVPVWKSNVEDESLMHPSTKPGGSVIHPTPALPIKDDGCESIGGLDFDDPSRLLPLSSSELPSFKLIRKPITLLAQADTNLLVHPQTSIDAGKDTSATSVSSGISSASPKRPMNLSFSVKTGEKLSSVLTEFVKQNGYTLQWNSTKDFVVQHAYSIRGQTFENILREVIAPYSLSATVWEGNTVVEIYARTGEAE